MNNSIALLTALSTSPSTGDDRNIVLVVVLAVIAVVAVGASIFLSKKKKK